MGARGLRSMREKDRLMRHRLPNRIHNFAEDQPVDDIQEDKRGGKNHPGNSVDANCALPPLLHDFFGVMLFAPRPIGARPDARGGKSRPQVS